MKRLYAMVLLVVLLLVSAVVTAPAAAEESHARIVRLSLVQGDVRFTQQFHRDSLADNRAGWEVAPLNLPVRQGFAVATGADGRAEVEFENGAMAFLSANTVLEFYDLSLYDGSVITRLVLRQGSGIFYVHPARGDYFSVTGGDFSVEANGRARFRLDNYDDGSNLNVEVGNVTVLHKEETKSLTKGQSYSVNVNEGAAGVVGRASDGDDFDKWVSGRIDSVVTATAYANQYVSTPSYTAGFADLYSYGSWYNIPGYGFGWQPFGVGMGWCPFGYGLGNWMWDASMGWNFIGFAPWGWLPYHYGGWVFSPMYGWVWLPSGFGYGPTPYRPVTGVWVHNGHSVGLVPIHPLDAHGKTPINLSHGIYAVNGNAVASNMVRAAGQKWSVERNPGHNTLEAAKFASTTAPTRVSRTILSGSAGSRPVTVSRDSSIVYDAGQHRFVNGNSPAKTNTEAGAETAKAGGEAGKTATTQVAPRLTTVPQGSHGTVPAARANITPPRPSAGSVGTSHPSAAGASWGGHGSSGGSSSSGSHTASAPAPAPSHSSGGSSSHH